MKFLNNVSNN